MTPLHRAAFNGDKETVEELLEQGADINALADADNKEARISWGGVTPLGAAALNNSDPEVVALLLDRSAELDAEFEVESHILLFAAWNNANPAVLELLLDRATELGARDDYVTGLLFSAAELNPNLPVIEYLLDLGADVNGQASWEGKTPLHFAVEGNPNPGVVALLLDWGADINVRDHNAKRPCEVAEATGTITDTNILNRLCAGR